METAPTTSYPGQSNIFKNVWHTVLAKKKECIDEVEATWDEHFYAMNHFAGIN